MSDVTTAIGASGTPALLALVETIEALSSARTVEDVADVVRGRARRISGADGVAFVRRDGDLCHYLDEDAIAPLWKGRRFPMSRCISGWAMSRGETAVIPDIYVDDRIPHDAYRPTFVKSLVMTPVRPADPIAAIGAYWAERRQPTPDEVTALSVLARATATALENVELLGSLRGSLEHRERLIAELDHRVKNTLAATLAIANQTLVSSPAPEAFVRAFQGRLLALAAAHEILARSDWTTADLGGVARRAVDAVGGGDRVDLSGPPVRLAAETAISAMLAFHELASNARRHGALSTPDGQVVLAWTVEEGVFALRWRERNGPPVSAPAGKGLGLRLVDHGLARDLAAEARYDFSREGFTYDLRAPLSARIMVG